MSIKIDQEKCIGCGTCVSLCPHVFKLNDEGKSTVINGDDEACAQNAAAACPVSAITVN